MTVRTKFIGRWHNTGVALAMAPQVLRNEIQSTIEKSGEIILREIDHCIDSGGYGTWPPLSDSWRKRSPLFFEDTGELRSFITSNFTHTGPQNYRMAVGLRPDSPTHYSGLEANRILDILEEERPIFALVWPRVESRVNRSLRKIGGKVFGGW